MGRHFQLIYKDYPGLRDGNFGEASFSTFRDFPERSFCDGEVSDGSGSINAICSRPEVADDVVSGTDVNYISVLLVGYLQ